MNVAKNLQHVELKAAQELKRELVDGLVGFYVAVMGAEFGHRIPETIKNIESLIKKTHV